MAKYGTMDLSNRPGVWTPEGPATVLSMSFQDRDGKETIIPTVSRNGLLMSEDEAIDEYRRTGNHLGKHNTVKEAEDAAQQIHLDEEKRIKEMAKATKNPDKIFNDMVQQEMQNGGRSLAMQQAINRGRAAGYTPTGTRSDAMLDAVTRGHVLNTPWQSDLQPQAREQLTQHQADELYNFARGNNMAGNGQGFSSRDYLNAVDLFDKYMKGETNDTSWSDFFDKHGLKPISRSNLEKRYRASWDSDAGKGQGPVPTGEQQAIMQQVAQAQQGGAPVVSNAPSGGAPASGTPDQIPTVVNGGGRDDADYREGGYILPDERYSQPNNPASDYAFYEGSQTPSQMYGVPNNPASDSAFSEAPKVSDSPSKKQVPKSRNHSPKSSGAKEEVGLSEIAPVEYQDDVSGIGGIYDVSEPYISSDGKMARRIAGAASIGLPIAARHAVRGLGMAGIPLSAAEYGYSNRYRILDNLKDNSKDEDYYNNNNDFY